MQVQRGAEGFRVKEVRYAPPLYTQLEDWARPVLAA